MDLVIQLIVAVIAFWGVCTVTLLIALFWPAIFKRDDD